MIRKGPANPELPKEKKPFRITLGKRDEREKKERERRKEIEGAVRSNESVSGLLAQCYDDAGKLDNSLKSKGDAEGSVLQSTLMLYNFCQSNDEHGKELEELLKESGVRKTKATTNEFTPLVKLVLGRFSQSRTSISRYANVLKYANSRSIDPLELNSFVASEGGLVKCARKQATSAPQGAQRADEHRTLLDNAKTLFSGEKVTSLAESEYISVLLHHDGSRLWLLSVKDEKEQGLKKYKPLPPEKG